MASPIATAVGTAAFAPAASAEESAAESAAYRKVTWRLIPFLVRCHRRATVQVGRCFAVLSVPARLVNR